jgi:hypothetical protein
MRIRLFVVCCAVAVSTFSGCSGDSGTSTPTGPSGTSSTPPPAAPASLSLTGIRSVPDGAGVQYHTDFQLTAEGSFPSGTQFIWNLGDGSSTTTTTPTVGRVYGQAGVFNVTVEARSGSASASANRQVTTRSLLGRWVGTVTGFTSFPQSRQVPITGFELLVSNQTLNGPTLMLHGRWADDAGCRETRPEQLRQRIQPEPAATVTFGVNGLSCADGDFYLTGVADATFDRVEGHCNVVGNNPNCRFTMRRE